MYASARGRPIPHSAVLACSSAPKATSRPANQLASHACKEGSSGSPVAQIKILNRDKSIGCMPGKDAMAGEQALDLIHTNAPTLAIFKGEGKWPTCVYCIEVNKFGCCADVLKKPKEAEI